MMLTPDQVFAVMMISIGTVPSSASRRPRLGLRQIAGAHAQG